jgi:hypothetical protein
MWLSTLGQWGGNGFEVRDLEALSILCMTQVNTMLFRLMLTRGEEMEEPKGGQAGWGLSWLNEEHIARQCPEVAHHSIHFPLVNSVNPVYRILRSVLVPGYALLGAHRGLLLLVCVWGLTGPCLAQARERRVRAAAQSGAVPVLDCRGAAQDGEGDEIRERQSIHQWCVVGHKAFGSAYVV